MLSITLVEESFPEHVLLDLIAWSIDKKVTESEGRPYLTTRNIS